MFRTRLVTLLMFVVFVAASVPASAQTTPPPTPPPPVPKPAPFPGANQPATPPTTTKPTTTKPAPAVIPPQAPQQDGGSLDPRLAGVPIYPGAELLSSFDTGRGQQVFLLGSSMPYSDIVGFYKGQLRNNGSEIFRSPSMHQFDLGTFRSETMAYRPSLVVKDYAYLDSPGYLHVTGTTEKRFRTVIQIVPITR